MASAEPLTEEGSPPYPEAQTVELEMEDKMVGKKAAKK